MGFDGWSDERRGITVGIDANYTLQHNIVIYTKILYTIIIIIIIIN
jgi:hypothetical protein